MGAGRGGPSSGGVAPELDPGSIMLPRPTEAGTLESACHGTTRRLSTQGKVRHHGSPSLLGESVNHRPIVS